MKAATPRSRQSASSLLTIILWGVFAGLGATSLGQTQGEGQGQRSLTDLDIEFTETKLTLQVVTEENKRLREQLLEARQSVAALSQSLAIANSEAEVFRREAAEQKLRMEALGIDAVGSDKAALENRLIKAVQQLQTVHDDKQQLEDQLIRLNESLLAFLRTAQSEDATARMNLETELRNVAELLGATNSRAPVPAPVAPDLVNGLVMSVKNDLSLIVANIGNKHGVKVGMPFGIWREGTQIGKAIAVDVREALSGLIIQYLSEDKNNVNVGDNLRVEVVTNSED